MTYRAILQRFKDQLPGTRAVIFCDHEGETIDFVSDYDSYHTQLLGAYQADVLLHIRRAASSVGSGAFAGVAVRAEHATISAWPIGTGYYLTVMSKRPVAMTHPAVICVTRQLRSEI
jgi:predicted regulator of Ras-like GTPase activity (Roadblock/LC7/MglB family)